jgi:hypothetical protein
MKAKLIKTENGYGLKDCELIAFVSSRRPEHKHHKLSLKNCQAIERGYDVYELAKENYHKFWSVVDESEMLDHTFGYVEGFQKALEILGDKKFSEKELTMLFAYGHQIGMNLIVAVGFIIDYLDSRK